MKKSLKAAVVALTASVAAFQATTSLADTSAMPDPTILTEKVDGIKAKFQPALDALAAEGEEATKNLPSKEETMIGVSVGKMKRQDWYVKIPEFVMRQQTLFVKVPEFTMKEQRWSFDLPEPCMKYQKLPWGGGLHLPSVCNKRHEWFVKVPEVSVKEQKWILGIPEVTMKEQHWILDLPEIKVESSKKRIDEAKAKGEELSERGQAIAGEMSTEIKAAARAFLTDTRTAVAAQFDPAINLINAAFEAAPDAAKGELKAQLADVERSKAEVLKAIDDQIVATGI
ncbi:hypothetical protein [Rhizobium ruizarguesonis]|uniref:hypothetical protein n=1 Tax=Rhizobium ruizarguesonis TaxID=2081791 RepID=UPI00102F77EA|nr:hypothetical protein [Rhizobium ruizarguesonis]TAU61542.1 hypothetical protein ELI46_30385 [Rhizobium ruizarguesonis]